MSGVATRERRAPPRVLMRAMNAVPRLVLRSPLHGLMDGKVLLLGFVGRRSGRRYTTPMSYVRAGDEVLMTTEAPWWKNLAGGAGGGKAWRQEPSWIRRDADRRRGCCGGIEDDLAPISGVPGVRRRDGGRGRSARRGDDLGSRPPG